jgi:hypothetical protein
VTKHVPLKHVFPRIYYHVDVDVLCWLRIEVMCYVFSCIASSSEKFLPGGYDRALWHADSTK